jgi:hypothetical protein
MSFIEVPMGYRDVVVVDPCAADGAAVGEVCRILTKRSDEVVGSHIEIRLFACELETKRFEQLELLKCDRFTTEKKAYSYARHDIVNGDGLKLVWDTNKDGASLLFLNPPYENKRLEFEFTERYVRCLGEGGVLILIVPGESLDKLAPILARTCEDLSCFRFPGEHYETFGQVVVFAKRRPTLIEPDASMLAMVLGWWGDRESIPELPTVAPERRYTLPVLDSPGFRSWAIAPVDVPRMYAQFKPWHTTDRGGQLRTIPGIAPTRPINELLERRYLLAMPPKPAHIAGALASGVFNGAVVKPNESAVNFPKLLVNGAFRKKYRHLEDKVDDEGEKKGEIRVESPELVITVLDLDCMEFHTLPNTPNSTGALDVASMGAADFIDLYGHGLLDVMRRQCPVVHDPDDPAQEFPLPEISQPLFKIQRHAVMALVKLLGGPNASKRMRREMRAGLDGEMGTGKTRMGAMVARLCGAKRVLVMCPTHLLTTWPEEIMVVDPSAKVMVLDDVADVDRFFADKYDGMIFGIISKETAKLGHKWADISSKETAKMVWSALVKNMTKTDNNDTPEHVADRLECTCPRCGSTIMRGYEGEFASKRVRCSAEVRTPANVAGQLAQTMSVFLLPFVYSMPDMGDIMCGRNLEQIKRRTSMKFVSMDSDKRASILAHEWTNVRHGEQFAKTIKRFTGLLLRAKTKKSWVVWGECLAWLLHARDELDTTLSTCQHIYAASVDPLDDAEEGRDVALRAWAREALQRADIDDPRVDSSVERLKSIYNDDIFTQIEQYGYGRHGYPTKRNAWTVWERELSTLRRGQKVDDIQFQGEIDFSSGMILGPKTRVWHDVAAGAVECARKIIAQLAKSARWSHASKCGEPLFQAIPEPRRYPLANYISERYADDFDFYICDEVHEMKGDGTAQSFAFHRLAMCGAPSLFMTGTWMNGKAESTFNVQWQIDPEFRREFAFNARSAFKDIYGYKKIELSYRDRETRKVVEYGSSSDRVELVTRDVGDAPGILPIFLPRFLLRRVVVVHKSELDRELPPCREYFELIKCDEEQAKAHKAGLDKLTSQIRRDKRSSRAGQLLGALVQFQSQPDLCTMDTGNMPDGSYEIRYPEKVEKGRKRKARKRNVAPCGELLYRIEPLPKDRIMPKEARTIEIVKAQLARGRNCMVFAWNEPILPRLARLIEEAIGEPVALLESRKVEPYERKAHINANVIAKGIRVLVVSPAAVQTGLNNLIFFPTQIWTGNPAVNPTIYRQARDRSHRIGQTQDVEVYFLAYLDTAQIAAHKLLMTKVGVAMSTDGLDARSVLLAAGIGESDTFDLLSVGKQLYAMMDA